MEVINNVIDEFIRQHREYTEKALAEIITEYDFLVGSIECAEKLTEILPKGAKIVYSPYIENPTMVYAIKKFDVKDLLKEEDKMEPRYVDPYAINKDKFVYAYCNRPLSASYIIKGSKEQKESEVQE